jgi:hypothetical protein
VSFGWVVVVVVVIVSIVTPGVGGGLVAALDCRSPGRPDLTPFFAGLADERRGGRTPPR